MGTASPNYTILLSMKSPIFAPLYLAKVRGGAFRYIDFKYVFQLPASLLFPPKSRRGARDGIDETLYDPLAAAVLSKAPENAKYIAGVADPFRALLADTDGSMYQPKITAGFIRHQAFWLATHNEELRDLNRHMKGKGIKTAKESNFIVTPPRYTSGYAVLRKALGVVGEPPPKCTVEYYQGLTPGLYFKTTAGFEKQYCAWLDLRSRRKFKYSYLTTDPSDHDSPLIQFAKSEHGHNTLMSALFSGNGKYVRHPMLFDDLRYDLAKAMEIIYRDPVRGAIELKEYANIAQDQYMSFANDRIPHSRLVEILDELFLRYRIYCTDDLKIKRNWIDLGVDLRPRFHKPLKEADGDDISPVQRYHDKPEEFVADYFVPEIIAPADPNDDKVPSITRRDQERTDGMSAFVRQTSQNYREYVEAQYESSEAPLVSTAGVKRFVLSLLPLAAASAGGVAVAGAMNALHAWPNWIFYLILCLPLMVGAYFARSVRRIGVWWLYDLTMLIAMTELAVLGIVELMLWAFRSMVVPHYKLSDADEFGLLLFCGSTAILVFGGFVIATLDRCRDLWVKYIARWPERLIWITRVARCRSPCAREHCRKIGCPLNKMAKAQAKASAATI